jgi:hypothetical protein
VVDASREQCVDDADCARLGPEFEGGACEASLCRPKSDPAWACLDGQAEAPPPITPSQIRFTGRLVDVVFQKPVPGIDLRVCERLDPECSMPLAAVVSDEQGEVNLTLPGGFNGYLRWQSPNTQPVLFFFPAPLSRDTVLPLGVVTPQIMAGLDVQFERLTIEGRAVAVVYATDCAGAPAVGVRLSVLEGDSSTRVFYEADGLFPASQRETTQTGVVRAINVPTGNVSLRATLSDGREIGTARVLTRAGFVTLTILSPEPR